MQEIRLKNAKKWRTVNKSFESNIIPRKGDFLADSAFKDPYEYEVGQVIIDYAQNLCIVYLAPVELNGDSKERLEQEVEMYKLHNWESSYDLIEN